MQFAVDTSVTTVAIPFSTLASDGQAAGAITATSVDVYDDEFSSVIGDASPTMTPVEANVLYTFDVTTNLLTAGKVYTALYEYVVSSVTYYSITTFTAY